jgi:hypothetical protein
MSISASIDSHPFVRELRLFCGLHEHAALPRRMIRVELPPALRSGGAVRAERGPLWIVESCHLPTRLLGSA